MVGIVTSGWCRDMNYRKKGRLLGFATSSIALVLAFAGGASVAGEAEHLCLVAVKDGAPTEADLGQSWRMVSTLKIHRPSPYPIINPLNRDGIWTISAERRFVPYPDEFPSNSILQTIVEETHSGRVLGFSHRTRLLYVLSPSSGRFQSFDPRGVAEIGAVNTVVYIARWRGILIGTNKGLFLLQEDTITPVEGVGPVAFGEIHRIFDLPSYGAVALAVGNDGHVVVRTDAGRAFQVADLTRRHESGFRRSWSYLIEAFGGESDWGARVNDHVIGVFELGSSDGIVILSIASTLRVPMEPWGNGYLPGAASLLDWQEDSDEFEFRRHIGTIGEFVLYRRSLDRSDAGEPGLFRVGSTGMEPVSGEQPATSEPHRFIYEVPSRRLAVFTGMDRLYAFDGGNHLVPISGSRFDEIGLWPRIYDLPNIGRVIVTTVDGLFELTPSNAISPLPPPAGSEGISYEWIIEMPASDVAIVFTDRGIFALERAGGLTPVPGGELIRSTVSGRSRAGIIPQREELFFVGRDALYLIIDRRIAGPEACPDLAQPAAD